MNKYRFYILLFLSVFVLYMQALSFSIINLDDQIIYLIDPDIKNWSTTFQTLQLVLYPFYRPILIVSYLLDSLWAGYNPGLFHLTNIVLHSISVCLLFNLLKNLNIRKKTAFIFSFLFAVHPLNTQAIAWIAGRNDLLLAIFSLLCFLSFIKLVESYALKRLFRHSIFFLIALLTKETAIVIPLICLIYLLLFKENWLKELLFKLISGWVITYCIWLILFFALGQRHDTGIGINWFINSSLFLFQTSGAYLLYLGKTLFPFNLSVMPNLLDGSPILGILVLALLILIIFRFRQKKSLKKELLFSVSWFFLFLTPALLQHSKPIVAYFLEHRAYVPLVGIVILFAKITDQLKINRYLLNFIYIFVGLLFIFLTFTHSQDYRNRNIYIRSIMKTAPFYWQEMGKYY